MQQLPVGAAPAGPGGSAPPVLAALACRPRRASRSRSTGSRSRSLVRLVNVPPRGCARGAPASRAPYGSRARGVEPADAAVGQRARDRSFHALRWSLSRSSAASSNCSARIARRSRSRSSRPTRPRAHRQAGAGSAPGATYRSPSVVGGAVQPAQQVAQLGLEVRVALGAPQPAGLAEILQRGAEHGQAARVPAPRGARRLCPCAARKLPSGVLGSSVRVSTPSLRRALLAQVQRRHLLLDDLRQVAPPHRVRWHWSHSIRAPTPAADSPAPAVPPRGAAPGRRVAPAGRLWVTTTTAVSKLARQAREQVVQPLGVVRVEVARRLVGQQEHRVGRQRPRHRHPLLLAARQLRRARCVIRPARPTAASSSSARRRAAALGAPRDQQRHHHVLERGELPQQVMELEHEPDRPVPQRGELRRRSARRTTRPSSDTCAGGRPVQRASRCSSVLLPPRSRR